MIPRAQEEDWDLTPVIDLIYSLSIRKEPCTEIVIPESSPDPSPETPDTFPSPKNGIEQTTQLGNFDRIWQYLGQPTDLLPPNVPLAPKGESIDILDNNGHNDASPLKAVKWRDELEGADLADNDENYDSLALGSLTKSQRKKARRKERRKVEALTNRRALPSESEDDLEKDGQEPQPSDRKAVIHEILHGAVPPKDLSGRLRSGKVYRAEPTDAGAWPVVSPHSARKAVQILQPPRDSTLAIAAAKTVKLMTMLTQSFVDERQYLKNISFVQHPAIVMGAAAEGLHVFVDASNIMIGFHNALKVSRGQSIHQRIRRQALSFHNFSLILERGRPTAKRILVGSDNFPAISEAKAIGYETNILDRVHKAKELTPRQKKFLNSGTGTGTGSGSETTAAVQYAPEKWVEQAVDEILHLKMMESIVDVSEPSVMVLATGDAAEAEYSAGFLKMVERALGKGWKVELASFKHNMSGAYKRNDFRQKWGERFRVVELDNFVEVLLGSE